MEATKPASDPQTKPAQSNGFATTKATLEAIAPPGTPVNPWAPDEGRRVTLAEYWAKWYENPYPDIDVSYEWNNGILEAKSLPNRPQFDLYTWFLAILHCHVETYPRAALFGLETGFVLRMAEPEEASGERVQVRKPDIGVILDSNPAPWGELDQRHFDGVCDIVAEVVSDSTRGEVLRDTEEKKRDYALAGVQEYYILDPSGEHMRFYRLTPSGEYEAIQPDAEGVIFSEVLPGFQFRLKDLERRPELVELALDAVYSEYIIPALRVAVRRAEQAEEQAAVEAAARQQAEERAQALEAELARLRRQRS